MALKVRSEIGPLEAVIVHRPGDEHRYTLPMNTSEWAQDEGGQIEQHPDYLLFDDIVALDRITEEHDRLTSILACQTGDENVLEFTKLLEDVASEQGLREIMLEEALCLDAGLYDFTSDEVNERQILDLPTDQFVDVLVSGRYQTDGNTTSIFKWPLPNLIFSRDIAAVVGARIVLCWAKWSVRKREMLLSRFVFIHHPLFDSTRKFDFAAHYPHFSIEGGDILVLSDRIVCIGISERSPREGVEALLPVCFEEGFEAVYAIELPKSRSLMHLDTCFTRINVNECLVFPPLFSDGASGAMPSPVYRITAGESLMEKEPEKAMLLDLLRDDGLDMIPINCGGDDPVMQAREQWTDGANAFALAPGKIITYARNLATLSELADRGYRSVTSEEFLSDTESIINSEEKLVITLKASELSRGRGGPRCLTMPIGRTQL